MNNNKHRHILPECAIISTNLVRLSERYSSNIIYGDLIDIANIISTKLCFAEPSGSKIHHFSALKARASEDSVNVEGWLLGINSTRIKRRPATDLVTVIDNSDMCPFSDGELI
jgi:hypothetical protein